DAEVDRDVRAAVAGAATGHDERRRLLASPVASRLLAALERLEQPLCERRPAGRLERGCKRVDRVAGGQNVALGRVAVAGPPAGPVQAAGAGVRSASTLRVDDAELPLGPLRVCSRQSRDGLRGGDA